jgi:hypothetical protein
MTTPTIEEMRKIVDDGIRELKSTGRFCMHCRMFPSGDPDAHQRDCPYAALASALEQLETARNLRPYAKHLKQCASNASVRKAIDEWPACNCGLDDVIAVLPPAPEVK